MTLFINAHLQPMCSDDIKNGFLLVENETIKTLGAMSHLPDNLPAHTTIDLEGRRLLPGFIDAHTHLGMLEEGVGEEGEDINEMSEPVTPHVRALDAIDPLDRCFEDARKTGVTTLCISPGSANPIAGQIVAMKSLPVNWADKMVISQPLAMKFAMGENPKQVYGAGREEAPYSRMATAAIIREWLTRATRYYEDKQRALAEEDTLPEVDFKLEALVPVITREIPAHFHAHRAYDILSAIRIAEEFQLDYAIIHCTEGYRIADVLAEKKVKAILGPLLSTRSKPELSHESDENVSALVHAGLEVAVSTDHPEAPVSLLPLSAALAADKRLSDQQALQTLTHWAAKTVGLEERVGSLAPGLDADLLVYSGNPLAVGVQPDMVFINGKQIR